MKAVFKGYKIKDYAVAELTVGKVYFLNETKDPDYFCVVDDEGLEVVLNPNGVFYYFEVLTEDEPLICSESFIDTDDSIETASQASLRYYINGNEVDMVDFENVRFKVAQLDEFGVKCDTIKFELKFE